MEFGRDRRPAPRWRYWALLACLVLAAAVLVAVRASGQHTHPAAKHPAVTATHLPPPRVTEAGRRLLGVSAGWELFARGPDDLVRIQLARGRVTRTYVPPLASGNPDVSFVIGAHEAIIRSTDLVPGYVVPDGGRARQLTGALAGSGPLISGPAGTQAVWVTAGSTAPSIWTMSLVTLTGHRSGSVIRFPPGGPQLPATAVSDGRGDVLVVSETATVYDAGPGWDRPLPGTVIATGPADWLTVDCAAQAQHCRNRVIDAADGTQRTLPGRAVGQIYSFTWPPTGVTAPDGSTAAVGISEHDGAVTVHLIDLHTGAVRDLHVPLGPRSDSGAYTSEMAWSPDSRWLFVAESGGKLAAVDAGTGRAESLGVSLPAVSQVAIRS